MSLADVCEREGISLAVDRVHYLERWVTPLGPPRRFDTRFFVAVAPASQRERHDEAETVDSVWISPTDALEKNAADEFGLMTVTQRHLAKLAEYGSVDELVAMLESERPFPVNRPVIPANRKA